MQVVTETYPACPARLTSPGLTVAFPLLRIFCYKQATSLCRQYTGASLFNLVVGAQLGGWAAKSIQPSMIHQIGVGICPERLDPAVAGLATRGRHSRLKALRLETCCADHGHRTW